MLRVLDLFSGIGGFSLGLERTGGFQTVAFCEIDPFCRRVLAKHWPEVKQYEDVRTLDAATLQRDGIAPNFICGGFPCQDVSHAGKRAGLEGERSGLWSEYARIIGDVRPIGLIVENVPGLLSLGMGRVLGDLAALGYDAVWDCVPAGSIGAPHIRDRVWLFAYPQHPNADDARSYRAALHIDGSTEFRDEQERQSGSLGAYVADASGARRTNNQRRGKTPGRDGYRTADCDRGASRTSFGWRTEPDVGRVAYGVPSRVDRLRSLGNAVVPQVVEVIGRAILQAEHGA